MIDIVLGMIASESRWSITHKDDEEDVVFIVFNDVDGFSKINIRDGKAVYVFSGNGVEIQKWKDWISGELELRPVISTEKDKEVSVCAVNIERKVAKAVGSYNQQLSVLGQVLFAGTGSKLAHKCWSDVDRDCCVMQAMQEAINGDHFSGGTVRYFNLGTKVNNLIDDTMNITDVSLLIRTEGFVMYMKDEPKRFEPLVAIPVSEAAKYDPRVVGVINGLADGSIVACAPSSLTFVPPTQQEINEFYAFIDEMG